jgi:hypothetical protein
VYLLGRKARRFGYQYVGMAVMIGSLKLRYLKFINLVC